MSHEHIIQKPCHITPTKQIIFERLRRQSMVICYCRVILTQQNRPVPGTMTLSRHDLLAYSSSVYIVMGCELPVILHRVTVCPQPHANQQTGRSHTG